MLNGPPSRVMESSHYRKRKRHAAASIDKYLSFGKSQEVEKETSGVSSNWDAENELPIGFGPQKFVKSKSESSSSFFNRKTVTQTHRIRDFNSSTTKDEECLEIEDDLLIPQFTRLQDRISAKASRNVPTDRQSPFQPNSSGPTPFPKHEQVPVRDKPLADTAWIDMFPPSGLSELAVNKKKVTEVSAWLQEALKGRPHRRLLVLKGPAGCGKTITVRLLAEQWNVPITEWLNPSKLEIDAENYASLSSRFDDFLNRGSTFTPLGLERKAIEGNGSSQNQQARPGIILIDDFPTSIRHVAQALDSIRGSIMRHLETEASTPAVFIFSEEDGCSIESSNRLDARNILGFELLEHPATAMIEFNRLAPTFMIKAVEQVIKKEACISHRKAIPSQAVLSCIVQSGDIRSAIGMLQLFCINAPVGRLATSTVSRRSSRKNTLTDKERTSLEGILHRESIIGLFHAVGKIMYNKREREAILQPPSYLSKHHRKYQSDIDIEDIMDHLGVDVDTFVAALHENYIPSCESHDSLRSVEEASLELSSADILGGRSISRASGIPEHRAERVGSVDFSRQDEMAFHTAARGMLFCLPFPVKRESQFPGKGHQKLKFPAASKLYGQRKEIQVKVDSWLRGSDPVAARKISLSALAHQKHVGDKARDTSNDHIRLPDDSLMLEKPASKLMARLSIDELLQYQMPFIALLGKRLDTVPGFRSLLDAVRLRSCKPILNASTTSITHLQGPGTIHSFVGEDNRNAAFQLSLSDDEIEDG